MLTLEASYIDGENVVALGSIRARSEVARTGFALLATAQSRSCAVYLGTGNLHCWGLAGAALGQGHNNFEALGRGGERAALPAIDLGSGLVAKQAAGGKEHVCALLDSGHVKCFGENWHGVLGLGLEAGASVGGSPGSMGDSLPNVNLGKNRKAKQISARLHHTCALLQDDTSSSAWCKVRLERTTSK